MKQTWKSELIYYHLYCHSIFESCFSLESIYCHENLKKSCSQSWHVQHQTFPNWWLSEPRKIYKEISQHPTNVDMIILRIWNMFSFISLRIRIRRSTINCNISTRRDTTKIVVLAFREFAKKTYQLILK